MTWIKICLQNVSTQNFDVGQVKTRAADITFTNICEVLQDGTILCQVLLVTEPNLPGILESLSNDDVCQRWNNVLRIIESRLQIPQLLRAEDIEQNDIDKVIFNFDMDEVVVVDISFSVISILKFKSLKTYFLCP